MQKPVFNWTFSKQTPRISRSNKFYPRDIPQLLHQFLRIFRGFRRIPATPVPVQIFTTDWRPLFFCCHVFFLCCSKCVQSRSFCEFFSVANVITFSSVIQMKADIFQRLLGYRAATNFKLGKYIFRAHANKSPLKIWENRERGRIQGLPKFLKYPLLSQERVKLRASNLAGIFRWSMQTKAL